MDILYIGYYGIGSTSRMRGEYLNKILKPKTFNLIDIDIPLYATNKILRTIGWRYKKGPLITNITNFVLKCLNKKFNFDLVWIDKGVFIDPKIVKLLRSDSKCLVHFTPDPAFTYHQSELFYKALEYYDYCITTKSFEIKNYENYNVKTLFCTQGFDPLLHKKYTTFEKKNAVVFIGHYEEIREEIIAKLIESKIPITLAGIKWNKFQKKYRGNAYLNYKGEAILGEDYAKELSNAKIGLGLLSKWIPELHTTRTIEIPACYSAIATERNVDTQLIFEDDEAIFFSSIPELIENLNYYLSDNVALQNVTEKAYNKIILGNYSYEKILTKILNDIDLL